MGKRKEPRLLGRLVGRRLDRLDLLDLLLLVVLATALALLLDLLELLVEVDLVGVVEPEVLALDERLDDALKVGRDRLVRVGRLDVRKVVVVDVAVVPSERRVEL